MTSKPCADWRCQPPVSGRSSCECFAKLPQWGSITIVQILAPRLEEIYWSGYPPSDLIFLSGTGSVQRLADIVFYFPENGLRQPAVSGSWRCALLLTSSTFNVSIKISDGTNQSMLYQKDLMEYMQQIPNVRVLYLRMVGILRFIYCPIAPVVSAFLRRCPNLTLLHIDLPMLHQFSELHPNELVLPIKSNDATDQQQGHVYHPCEISPRDQLQLPLLRDIRLNGFVGVDREIELANLLFGDGAPLPALERISVTTFRELRGGIHGIAVKMMAQLPFLGVGGRWETCNRNLVLTWTRTKHAARFLHIC